LPKRAGERQPSCQLRRALDATHQDDDHAEGQRDEREHHPAADTVDRATDPERARG
jgi:hypothetical protein